MHKAQYPLDIVSNNIFSAFGKLQREIYDPTAYTKNEICALNVILFYKNSILDCSLWDLRTAYGLRRFAEALSLQKRGYEYFFEICKKGKKTKNVG